MYTTSSAATSNYKHNVTIAAIARLVVYSLSVRQKNNLSKTESASFCGKVEWMGSSDSGSNTELWKNIRPEMWAICTARRDQVMRPEEVLELAVMCCSTRALPPLTYTLKSTCNQNTTKSADMVRIKRQSIAVLRTKSKAMSTGTSWIQLSPYDVRVMFCTPQHQASDCNQCKGHKDTDHVLPSCFF